LCVRLPAIGKYQISPQDTSIVYINKNKLGDTVTRILDPSTGNFIDSYQVVTDDGSTQYHSKERDATGTTIWEMFIEINNNGNIDTIGTIVYNPAGGSTSTFTSTYPDGQTTTVVTIYDADEHIVSQTSRDSEGNVTSGPSEPGVPTGPPEPAQPDEPAPELDQ
jgi:hypothetical protein